MLKRQQLEAARARRRETPCIETAESKFLVLLGLTLSIVGGKTNTVTAMTELDRVFFELLLGVIGCHTDEHFKQMVWPDKIKIQMSLFSSCVLHGFGSTGSLGRARSLLSSPSTSCSHLTIKPPPHGIPARQTLSLLLISETMASSRDVSSHLLSGQLLTLGIGKEI